MVIMQALDSQQVCRHCIWFWPMCSMSKTPALSACTWHLARSALDPSPYSTSSITMVYLVLVALRWRNPSCSRNKLCRSVCVRESASVSVWVKHKHSNACEWVRVCGRACEWVRVCGSGSSLHEWELCECKCYTRNRSTHMKHTQHTLACCSKQINVKKPKHSWHPLLYERHTHDLTVCVCAWTSVQQQKHKPKSEISNAHVRKKRED